MRLYEGYLSVIEWCEASESLLASTLTRVQISVHTVAYCSLLALITINSRFDIAIPSIWSSNGATSSSISLSFFKVSLIQLRHSQHKLYNILWMPFEPLPKFCQILLFLQ